MKDNFNLMFINKVSDSKPTIVQYNLSEFIEEILLYISSNQEYKPKRLEVFLECKNKREKYIIRLFESHWVDTDNLYYILKRVAERVSEENILWTWIDIAYIEVNVDKESNTHSTYYA